ncbi:MAG: MerR family transcriptional regulator [Cellulosilyticaceae bacterium]
MKQLYGIGEVAKTTNLTIKALRYYHEVGIIIPAYIDPDSGYRYYTADQFLHIDIVKYCRGVGVSIKELQALFEIKDTARLLDFLKKKKCEIEEHIASMGRIISDIDTLDEVVQASKTLLAQEEVMTQWLPQRTLVVLPCKGVEEAIAYAKVRKLVEEHDLSVSDYGRGYIFEGEHVQSEYLFGILEGSDQELVMPLQVPIKVLPEGEYVILSYTKETQEAQVAKLKAYMAAHGLEARTFIELDLVVDFFNDQTYSCQLQMPIERES